MIASITLPVKLLVPDNASLQYGVVVCGNWLVQAENHTLLNLKLGKFCYDLNYLFDIDWDSPLWI